MIDKIINKIKDLKLDSDQKIDWKDISVHQKLSEAFIDKHCDNVDWGVISQCQQLSEAFIEKHCDKVDWGHISWGQKLSEAFIDKHCDNVDWGVISKNKHLSEKTLQRCSFADNSLNMRRKELLRYVIFDLTTLIANYTK